MCKHCFNGILHEDGVMITCPYCSGFSILNEIDEMIRGDADMNRVRNLEEVKKFLPHDPFFAILTAEDLDMSEEFVKMLRDYFGILPLI